MELPVPGKTQQGETTSFLPPCLQGLRSPQWPTMPAEPQKPPPSVPPCLQDLISPPISVPPCLQDLKRTPQCSTMSAGPQKIHHACRASEGPPSVFHHVCRASEAPLPQCSTMPAGPQKAPSICRIESPAPPCSEAKALVAGTGGREPGLLTGWLLPPSSISQDFARGRRNMAGNFCVGCSLWSAHTSSVSFSRAWLR